MLVGRHGTVTRAVRGRCPPHRLTAGAAPSNRLLSGGSASHNGRRNPLGQPGPSPAPARAEASRLPGLSEDRFGRISFVLRHFVTFAKIISFSKKNFDSSLSYSETMA